MQSDRHERIRERAYQIWVADGRVHGKDEEHWHRAERAIAEEELRVAAALADRAATAPRRRPGMTAPTAENKSAAPASRRGRRPPGEA